MSEITIHRVPLYMSKNVNIICVGGIPVCATRGNLATSNIVAKLIGSDVEIKDRRINELVSRKGESDNV